MKHKLMLASMFAVVGMGTAVEAREVKYGSYFTFDQRQIDVIFHANQQYTIAGKLWGHGRKGANPVKHVPIYLKKTVDGRFVGSEAQLTNDDGEFNFTVTAPSKIGTRVSYVLEFKPQGNLRGTSYGPITRFVRK